MVAIGGVARLRSSRGAAWLAGLLTCSLIQAGCDEYRIAMRARGDGTMERTLSFWDDGEPQAFGKDRAARLAAAYGKEVDGGAHVATSSFSEATPQDVGGAGSYTRISSQLGSAHAYIERFRGTDDLITPVEEMNARIEGLVEFVAGWLEAELGEDPAGPVLGRFVRERVGPDLENLHLYLVVSRVQEDGRSAVVRMVQYLAEREYFAVADLPRLARRLEDDDDRFILDYAARLAAAQLGTSREDPIPEKLGFLTDPNRLEASFEAHIRSTSEFRRWVEEHPDVEPDKQAEKWFDAAFPLPFTLSFDSTTLRIALELPGPPIATNGTWDAETRRVDWAARTLPDEEDPTALAYAIWAEPDPEFQQAHFGRVLLEGEGLSRYAFVCAGLTARESSEWNTFVAGLEPEAVLSSIRDFRFADEPLDPDPPGDQPLPSRAKELITLLSEAIEAPESKSSDAR